MQARPFILMILLLLAVMALGLTACSAGAPATPVAVATTAPSVVHATPTTASTTVPNTAPIQATTAPTTAPTAAPTQAATAPTTAPTAAPTTAAIPSNPLAAAVFRVGTAPSLRLHNAITGDAALMSAFYGMPTDPSAASMVEDAEFSGSDFHSVSTGLSAMMMGGGDKLESTGFQGKIYVHGPVPILNAPDDKWYQLPPGAGMTFTTPSGMLGKIETATGGWESWAKAATGQPYDGQTCDVYTANKAAATKSFQAVLNNTTAPGAPTIDDGSMTAAVCPDGYLHDLGYTLKVHKDTQKGEIKFDLHLSEFGNVTVQAPTDFVVLTDSNGPAPTETSGTDVNAPTPTDTSGTDVNAPTPTNTSGNGSGGDSITPEPTETQAATQDQSNSVAVVQTFFDDVNANKLDDAMALLGDGSIVTINGKAYMSAADVKTYFQGQVAKGFKYTVSDASAFGPLVKFTIQYGTTRGDASAITDNGNISILTLP